MDKLVAQVKEYAEQHYNDGGWDVIVECWDDAAIAMALHYYDPKTGQRHNCRTLASVLAHSILASCVSVWADRQADAVNSAF